MRCLIFESYLTLLHTTKQNPAFDWFVFLCINNLAECSHTSAQLLSLHIVHRMALCRRRWKQRWRGTWKRKKSAKELTTCATNHEPSQGLSLWAYDVHHQYAVQDCSSDNCFSHGYIFLVGTFEQFIFTRATQLVYIVNWLSFFQHI